jgi:hypothetical protein
MLIDLIFTGKVELVNFGFLHQFIGDFDEAYGMTPEIPSIATIEEVILLLKSRPYAHITTRTDHLILDDKKIKHVYVGLTADNGSMELLLFFNLNDVGSTSPKSAVDFLRAWAKKSCETYNFDYVVCQMDEGNENERYFDSNGALYATL